MAVTDKRSPLALAGELTMDSVAELLERGRELARSGELVVDLSAVTAADSAALALLLDWLRTARAAGHGLQLRQVPAGLASLGALYDVNALLALESDA